MLAMTCQVMARAHPMAYHGPMSALSNPPVTRLSFGDHLRHWRQHRRLSQLALAGEA